ncbi:hypothetical protein [Nocardia camponoti]|uniref:Uncharacterized protein n=1 Tax=Nocardia camponoti TaxID=1616106 RepID=A0A917QJ81_9NOCA|nr:hypothetical protein [Nocardia camponoti]GGK53263.1 hypothetical protein GCM10011591_26330 [Nocardia camponoti]
MADGGLYGQAEISAFNQDARDQNFTFVEADVRAVVKEIDAYIAGLQACHAAMAEGEVVSGFGTLPTGIELQLGFRKKAALSKVALEQLIQRGMELREGFFRAAKLTKDADATAAQRIQLAGASGASS